MAKDEMQYHLRWPPELQAKIKQRAKMNKRSLNSEILAALAEYLEKPSPVAGFRDEAERLASIHAEEIKQLVMERLVTHYRNNK